MIELSIRLVLAGLLMIVAGVTGAPSFGVAFEVAICQICLALFVNYTDKKQLRFSATSALFASADSIMISVVLAHIPNTQALEMFAFLSLAPLSIANGRHG